MRCLIVVQCITVYNIYLHFFPSPVLGNCCAVECLYYLLNYSHSGDREIHQEDFGDIISSQQEINRLRADVRRLTIEVQHWRRVASDLQVGC